MQQEAITTMKELLDRILAAIMALMKRLSPATATTTTTTTPPIGPDAALSALPGVGPDSYTSPIYGWSLSFDPLKWTATDASSAGVIDTLSLTFRDEHELSPIVTFLTSPFGPEDIESRFEYTEDTIRAEFPGASVSYAKSANGEPIRQEIQNDHWVSTFLVSGTPGGVIEEVVELDCLTIGQNAGVLVIKATSTPTTYDDAFVPTEDLRDSIEQPGKPGDPQTGGGRPRVQF
jgi:hypothetical protein